MDRNSDGVVSGSGDYVVALRKESVDRNVCALLCGCSVLRVALRKESVDRNAAVHVQHRPGHASLSARRAWIEIRTFSALAVYLSSLSARRAWIEIRSVQCSAG